MSVRLQDISALTRGNFDIGLTAEDGRNHPFESAANLAAIIPRRRWSNSSGSSLRNVDKIEIARTESTARAKNTR
jgi:hypothetical protein